MAADRIHTLGIMAAVLATRQTNFPDGRGALSAGPSYLSPENAAKTAFQILAAVEKVQSDVDQRKASPGQ